MGLEKKMNQRYSRLIDIDQIILTKEFTARPYDEQIVLYREGLSLCQDLGLDRAQSRYQEFIHRIESGWLAELKGVKHMPTCNIAGCDNPVVRQCTYTKNEKEPRTEYFCQKPAHIPAFLFLMSSLVFQPNFESLTYTLGPRDIGMEDIDHFTCTVERYKE